MLQIFIFLLTFLSILAYRHSNARRICLVKDKIFVNSSFSKPILKEVVCYNTWCCSDGCCAWYFKLGVYFLFIVLILLVFKLFRDFWHKYCRDISTFEENEEIVMNSRTASLSRDGLLEYGTGSYATSLNFSNDEKPPSYEEVMAEEQHLQ